MFVAQDDSRENQIINLCGLTKEDSRIKHDATDHNNQKFEIKTVTKNKGVSTARQVHLKKIDKWRSFYWIVAKGSRTSDGMNIEEIYLLHPATLEPFFTNCECKILTKWDQCQRVLNAANSLDRHVIQTVEKVLEVGTRLDDPNIPLKLVRQGMPLSPNNQRMNEVLIDEFTASHPIK